MDPTLQALLSAVAASVVTGGALIAWYVSDRERSRIPEVEPPSVDPGVAGVLSVLRSSAVVLDDQDRVLNASAPAYAFGLIRDGELALDDLLELVRQVRRDGQIRESELHLGGHDHASRRTLTARVAPLGARQVLALVEDRTREKRVEAVRRDFVANVSHELKTPVGAIRLLAEAVEDAADDPEAVQRFAGRMLTESDRLSTMVQQIIELSRLQSSEPLEQPVPVSLDVVVSEAMDKIATKADAKQITLVRRGDHDLVVTGSADQVSAAVSNLVANAVAYSSDDSRVVISTTSHDGVAEISVVDQGIGIPEAEIDRIFERFYRVDPARHRSTGGTGLGLSIVKHVAATHGGEVSVWSVEGEGSTFTLTLPLRQEPTGAPTPSGGVQAPSTPTAGSDTIEAGPTDPVPPGSHAGPRSTPTSQQEDRP
ncbi:MAG: sensor histidine kinase [Nocardioides sp.]|uniref:sensor histidine kinase n=1 Tax=Nocardioides sp. TaxID=35761 RepID=UPI003F125DEE